jgi:hypothetical protein
MMASAWPGRVNVTGVPRVIEGSPGLSALNDSKYAYDARDSELRLTILRSPVYAFHTPRQIEPGVIYNYTDQGPQSVPWPSCPTPATGPRPTPCAVPSLSTPAPRRPCRRHALCEDKAAEPHPAPCTFSPLIKLLPRPSSATVPGCPRDNRE